MIRLLAIAMSIAACAEPSNQVRNVVEFARFDVIARARAEWQTRFEVTAHGAPRSRPERFATADLLARACELGDVTSCWRAVSLDHWLVPRLQEWLKRGCRAGEVRACLTYSAVASVEPAALWPDYRRAPCDSDCKLVDEGECARGYMPSCARLVKQTERPDTYAFGRYGHAEHALVVLEAACPEVEDACAVASGYSLIASEWLCRIDADLDACSLFLAQAGMKERLEDDDLSRRGRDGFESVCQTEGECTTLLYLYRDGRLDEPAAGRLAELKRWVCRRYPRQYECRD